MTEQNENLVLEILRRIQADQAATREDVREIKTRLTLIDENIAVIHREVGNLYALYAAQSGRLDRMENRLERIEYRLELREEQP